MSVINARQQQRLGKNTDFETNTAQAGQLTDLTVLDGWSLANGASEFRVAKAVGTAPSASGDSSLVLDNSVGAKGLAQTFDTTADGVYQIELNLALLAERTTTSKNGRVQVWWAGQLVTEVSANATEWNLHRFDVKATGATSALELRLVDSSLAVRLDNVAIYKKPAIGSGLNNGDEITASNAGDRINGDALDDTLYGGNGDDTLYGGVSGFDQLYGGEGNDRLEGGSGYDRLFGGAGADTLYGGADRDVLYGGTGHDSMFGGDGRDQLFGGAGNDTIYGDAGNDSLNGGAGSDILYGGSGNDTLTGGDSTDPTATNVLYGGTGNDVFYAGSESETFYGGDGIDTLSYERSKVGLKINLTDAYAGTGMAFGDIADADVEIVKGTRFSDDIYGTVGANNLQGLAGDDTLTGGNANDSLYGGAGNDVLIGGFGSNLQSGGSGSDTFVFNFNQVQCNDTISDFVTGQDKIKFTHNTESPSLPTFDKLAIQVVGNDTIVKFTTDTGFSSSITLANFKQAMTASDFIFA